MTPEQKVKWLIVNSARKHLELDPLQYPCDNIDDIYEDIENEEDTELNYDALQDGKYEIRGGEVETGLESPYSRHYESSAVAAQLPDGSWVGWTYWYGGGKHAEPEAMEWVAYAYDVECVEVQKIVREFSLKEA